MKNLQKIVSILIVVLLSFLLMCIPASAEEYSTDINDYPLVQDGNFIISYSSSSNGYFLLLTEDGNYFTTHQNVSGSCKIGCTGSYLAFILQNDKWVSYNININRTYKPLIANCNIYTDDTLTDIFFAQTVPDDPYTSDTDIITDTDTSSEAVETLSDINFTNTHLTRIEFILVLILVFGVVLVVGFIIYKFIDTFISY